MKNHFSDKKNSFFLRSYIFFRADHEEKVLKKLRDLLKMQEIVSCVFPNQQLLNFAVREKPIFSCTFFSIELIFFSFISSCA